MDSQIQKFLRNHPCQKSEKKYQHLPFIIHISKKKNEKTKVEEDEILHENIKGSRRTLLPDGIQTRRGINQRSHLEEKKIHKLRDNAYFSTSFFLASVSDH